MPESCNDFSLRVVSLSLSIPGTEVLNRSPAITTKSTFRAIHKSIAFSNASVLRLLSFGSLQLRIWQSARWANFMKDAPQRVPSAVYAHCCLNRQRIVYYSVLYTSRTQRF